MATKYRCTACGVETISSKACPKCGRRSTLVPVGQQDAETRDATADHGPPASSRSTTRRRRSAGFSAAAVVVLVAAGVAAAILMTSRRSRKHTSSHDKFEFQGKAGPLTRPIPHGRQAPRRTPPRDESCGPAYCLASVIEKPDAKPGGRLTTRHCFLLAPTPTPGRLWYVPVSYRVTWRGKDDRQPETILQVDLKGVQVSDKARVWLGSLAADVAEGENPMGRKLFYLARKEHGFGFAAPPTLTRPFLLQLATLVLTAAGLTPDPPAPGAETWKDSRPLALPARAPVRLWRRTGPGQWRIRSAPDKGTPRGKSASGASRLELHGNVRIPSPGRLEASLDWRTQGVQGHFGLEGLGPRCTREWKTTERQEH